MRTAHIRTLCLGLSLAATAGAQETTGDRVAVPLTDASRPATIKAHLVNGGITVKGTDTKEVVVEARPRTAVRRRSRGESTDGMTRLVLTSTGLTVTEDHNVVDISAASHVRAIDLVVQVPVKSSLRLACVNDGDIVVENVSGELEINNVNGNVTLTSVSGSAVAHALNGNLIASFREVTAGKAMSFSSMNGKVDVAFPADFKANVVLKSDNGEVLSDFDVKLDQGKKPIIQDSRDKGGKYRVQVEKAVYGTINGGGPEVQFKNFNGNIYIRKAK